MNLENESNKHTHIQTYTHTNRGFLGCIEILSDLINHQNKLVTGPEEIKTLLSKEYKERLRPRPTHPDFEDIQKYKNYAFKMKLEKSRQSNSSEWTMQEIDKVLEGIGQNKSQDPYGLNRSIFH